MKLFSRSPLRSTLSLCFGAAISFGTVHAAQTVNQVPGFVSQSKDLGLANATQTISVRVWLNAENNKALNDLLAQQYDRNSAMYHQWLTPAQYQANYSASSERSKAVQAFLAKQHLTVTASDGQSVTANGSIADVQRAFGVQLHNFLVKGVVQRANTTTPVVPAEIASAVAGVTGLSEQYMQPHSVRAVGPDGTTPISRPLSQSPNGAFFPAQCISPAETHNFTTNGGNPKATYTGLRYGTAPANSKPGTVPCGYAPGDIYGAYNLSGLYAKNWAGAGQTIVIVDAFGSTTIQKDLQIFDQVYGLPAANLQIVGTPVPATNSNIAGWAGETTLDVEWAHAIAPAAKIVLVIAPDNSNANLSAAIEKAVKNHYGNVVSNSYGAIERLSDSGSINAFETVIKQAAAQGISVHFSSGDSGDEQVALGIGLTSTQFPASSPYVTSVGGTSLVLTQNKQRRFETGWGNNATQLTSVDGVDEPPSPLGFQFGAGGGASHLFAKPTFQSKLSGPDRQVPDIAYLADPYTGVEIIQTDTTQQGNPVLVNVIGGTSLACPMFSGLWAVANQVEGKSLGQAARSIYGLDASAIYDIRQVVSPDDVRGVIHTASGTTLTETVAELGAPRFGTQGFVSAMLQGASGSWYVLTFGTDSSLTVKQGYDNVTGLGVPNGLAFVEAVTGK